LNPKKIEYEARLKVLHQEQEKKQNLHHNSNNELKNLSEKLLEKDKEINGCKKQIEKEKRKTRKIIENSK